MSDGSREYYANLWAEERRQVQATNEVASDVARHLSDSRDSGEVTAQEVLEACGGGIALSVLAAAITKSPIALHAAASCVGLVGLEYGKAVVNAVTKAMGWQDGLAGTEAQQQMGVGQHSPDGGQGHFSIDLDRGSWGGSGQDYPHDARGLTGHSIVGGMDPDVFAGGGSYLDIDHRSGWGGHGDSYAVF